MIRIVVILIVAALLGTILGNVQAQRSVRGWNELFMSERQAGLLDGSHPRAPLPEGAPRLELPDGDSYQFGQMQHGSSMSHDFVVRNIGEGPLMITQTGSTCKCTVGDLTNNRLLPGEQTTITLTWRAQTVTPLFAQSATFKTNDPRQPELRLQIEGSVIDSFVFEPAQLDLGDFLSNEGITREVLVYCYTDEDVQVMQSQWTDANTAAKVTLTIDEMDIDENGPHRRAARGYRMQVQVGEGMPLGTVASRIAFETNHGEEIEPPLLEVRGRVVSEITLIGGSFFRADSNILHVGNVSSKEGFTTSIWLVLRGDERDGFEATIEQEGAESSLRVTIGEPKIVAERTMVPIQFDVPKGAPAVYYPGNERGTFAKVTVRTNSDKLPELPIRVALVVDK